MGITGLLKGLQGVTEKRSVRDFANQSLAIDASSWLHKSVYSISKTYVEAHAKNPQGADPVCVKAATRYIIGRCQDLLTHANIHQLYLVLDGQRCPLKVVTNDSREQRRQQNLKEARRYIKQGQYKQAEEKYKSCIKINSAMASQVIEAVTQHFETRGGRIPSPRVICIKSPYEADAQLVKLCIDGLTHAIVTEDSDVLVYLAACQVSFPILFKLDRNSGACDVISTDWLLTSSSSLQHASSRSNRKKKEKKGGGMATIIQSLSTRQQRHPGLGARLFVQACVLTGCDYAPSQLTGVGLVTAFKLIRDHAHRSCEGRFQHVLTSMKQKITSPSWEKEKKRDEHAIAVSAGETKSSSILQQYEELLAKSEAVFYHHPVLQVSNQKIVFLTPPKLSSQLPSSTSTSTTAQREENVKSKKSLYNPNLSRFQGNFSFLGNIDGDNSSSLQIEKNPNVPVSEIIIKQRHGGTTSVHKGKNQIINRAQKKRPAIESVVNPYQNKKIKPNPGGWFTSKHGIKRKQQQEYPRLERTTKSSLPLSNIDGNHQSLSSSSSRQIAKMKKGRKEQQQLPPLPSSPATKNIFSQFQYSPTNEINQEDACDKENKSPLSSPAPPQQEPILALEKNNLSIYQYKKGRDIRFVKPKFLKQGGRAKPKKYIAPSAKMTTTTMTSTTATASTISIIQRSAKEQVDREVGGDENSDFSRLLQQPQIEPVDELPVTAHLPPTPAQVAELEKEDLESSSLYDESETSKYLHPANERVDSQLQQAGAAQQEEHFSDDEGLSFSLTGYNQSPSLDAAIETEGYSNTNAMIRNIDEQLRNTLCKVYQSDDIEEAAPFYTEDSYSNRNINDDYTNDKMNNDQSHEAAENDPPIDDNTYFEQSEKADVPTRTVTESSSSSSSLSVSSEGAVIDDNGYDENGIVIKQPAKHNRLNYVLGDSTAISSNHDDNDNDYTNGVGKNYEFGIATTEVDCDVDSSTPVHSKYWGNSVTNQKSKARRVTRSPQKSTSPTLDTFCAIGRGNHQSSEDEIDSFGDESPQPCAIGAQSKNNIVSQSWDSSHQTHDQEFNYQTSDTAQSFLDVEVLEDKDEEELMEVWSSADFSSTKRYSQSSVSSSNSRRTPFQLSHSSSLRRHHSRHNSKQQPHQKKSGSLNAFFPKKQHHDQCKSISSRLSSSSSSSSFFSRQIGTKYRPTKKSSTRPNSNIITGYFSSKR